MFDLYTISGGIIGIVASLYAYRHFFETDSKLTTNILTPMVKDVATRFQMTNINSVVVPSHHKRHIGGRVTIPQSVICRFNDIDPATVTYKWSKRMMVSSTSTVTFTGGGTELSHFVDVRLSRNTSNVAASGFGTVYCNILVNDIVVASGQGLVRLEMIPPKYAHIR